jgi:hypothetical protein
MLLEGQAVLSHQLANGNIWIFVGLCNGSIWKWTIRPEEGVRAVLKDQHNFII